MGPLINQSGERFWWADSLVSYGQKVDLCEKNAACEQALQLRKKAKKKNRRAIVWGGESRPFPSPQSTARPANFFYAVSLCFFAFFPPQQSLVPAYYGLDPQLAVDIRAQNSMKKNGETYQSRICFTEVKFLVDSCDLPTLIGNILEKKKHIHISDLCMQCYDYR